MGDKTKKENIELVDSKTISELLSHLVGEALQASGTAITEVTLESTLTQEEIETQISRARAQQSEQQVDLLRRASLGDVVAGITHQSRNIMTGVLSFSQIACHRNSDPKLEKLLESIYAESTRCVELMNQILTLARSREVHANNVHVRVLLGETISSACRLAEPAMVARQIRLDNAVSDTDLEVIGDGGALRDLFLNLLRNATEATPEGGSIRVSSKLEDETIALSFEDSGDGIAADARDRVFEAGFTTKGAGKGTGLGLAVSKQVAIEHKGDIAVDESPLGGARFLVTLMRAPAQEEGQ